MGDVSVFTTENYSYPTPPFTTQLLLNANLRTTPNWQVYQTHQGVIQPLFIKSVSYLKIEFSKVSASNGSDTSEAVTNSWGFGGLCKLS